MVLLFGIVAAIIVTAVIIIALVAIAGIADDKSELARPDLIELDKEELL